MLQFPPSRFVCTAARALALLWSLLLIRAMGPMTAQSLFHAPSFFV
ncbi:MAG: hypothetical protein KDJ44_01850 [Rhodoblastus sp.]|jgi:hypothetical protein|nr:hypothetical protein [Rhodoblastus sp.]MCC2106207.1 hypothetical protein [Hyphomicrobiales bacterium]